MDKLPIAIRRETEKDYKEVESVFREAFWNHYSPACCEHYMVHVMRACPAFIPELALLAELDGKIVGSVMSLKSVIKADNGNTYEVLSLGPIAVLPVYQGRGIGAKLIEETFAIAQGMKHRAVLLCGDPDYYLHHGFVPAEYYDIRTNDDFYMTALHAHELFAGALADCAGRYYEDPIYNVDEREVLLFDKSFPQKEVVVGTPSQLKFQEISQQVRKRDLKDLAGE